MNERSRFIPCSEFASPAELYRDPFLKDSERVMLFETLAVFDEARRMLGGPLSISSGRRSLAEQEALREAGYRAARYSPHCYGAALDVRIPSLLTDYGLAHLILAAAQHLNLPRPRIGYQVYRKDPGTRTVVKTMTGTEVVSSTFVHFDFVYLMRGLIEDVPVSIWDSWREGVTW